MDQFIREIIKYGMIAILCYAVFLAINSIAFLGALFLFQRASFDTLTHNENFGLAVWGMSIFPIICLFLGMFLTRMTFAYLNPQTDTPRNRLISVASFTFITMLAFGVLLSRHRGGIPIDPMLIWLAVASFLSYLLWRQIVSKVADITG